MQYLEFSVEPLVSFHHSFEIIGLIFSRKLKVFLNAINSCNVKVAPIAVYTSGKGSSAAGLTASVNRDPQSVFFIIVDQISFLTLRILYHYLLQFPSFMKL